MVTKPKKKAGRKAGESRVPENETKAEKFSRLATARVNKAVKYIEAVSNLAGSGYESTPEQIEKISDILSDAVKVTIGAFAKKAKTVKEEIKI